VLPFAKKHFTFLAEWSEALSWTGIGCSSFKIAASFSTLLDPVCVSQWSLLFLQAQIVCGSYPFHQSDDLVLCSMFWHFISGSYWNTHDSQPVIVQLRQCGLVQQVRMKSSRVTVLCLIICMAVYNKSCANLLFSHFSWQIWRTVSCLSEVDSLTNSPSTSSFPDF